VKTAGKGDQGIVVFSLVSDDSTCSECGRKLFRREFLRTEGERGLCMACADLDHLVFLPAGNTALTRRATKHSGGRVVVVRWSRARKRYERQGVLVTEEGLAKAEAECLSDADARARGRERAAERRAEIDLEFVAEFARRVRVRYPSCPKGEDDAIAGHACRKYSGRVGRSAAAKEFHPETIDLAVRAHVRHRHTSYDEILLTTGDRSLARERVRDEVESLVEKWAAGRADSEGE